MRPGRVRTESTDEPGLRELQGELTAWQKSAEGIVVRPRNQEGLSADPCIGRMKARTSGSGK